jgi:hypothetical protein
MVTALLLVEHQPWIREPGTFPEYTFTFPEAATDAAQHPAIDTAT